MNFKKHITQTLLFSFILVLIGCAKDGSSTITNNGQSGSLAKMVVVGDYLYVIDNETLTTFNVTNPKNPTETGKVEVGFGIETLFPFAEYLFIGSNDGLYIYSLSNPANPIPASSEKVDHFTACDPVVANTNYAYVTLNSIAESCGNVNQVNELQIVDVSDILNPTTVNIYQMKGPKGLGLDNNNLFVCDDDLGVIVFDLTIPSAPTPIDTLSGFTAHDIITDYGNLLVVGEDGLRQFDYSDINNISQISFLDLND